MSITHRRRTRRAFAAVAVVAVSATACSSSSGSKNSTTSTSGASGGSGTTVLGSGTTVLKADPNGIIKIGYDLIQTPGAKLFGDPAAAPVAGTSSDALYYLVYGRFLSANLDGTFTPQLAKSATITDKNTIDVVLRDGETFSDGTPFDGAAVKAGLERSVAAHNEAAFQDQFFSLKSVDVVSPTEVKLNFPDGTAGSWFDAYIAAWQTSIPKPGETNWDKPVGAGEMVVTRYARGQELVLAKNPKYFDPTAVKVAGMDFVHVNDASPQSGIAALKSGQLDTVFTDPSQLASLSGADKSFSRISPDQTIWLHMCKRSGPLANANVRIAINKALDRDAINKAVFQDTAEPSTELWPTGHKFNDPSIEKLLAYDPAGAKKLLQDAGFGGGFSVDVYPIAFAGISDVAVVMKQELAAVGITANIKTTSNYVNDYLTPQADGIGIYPGNSVGVQKLNGWTGNSLGNVCRYKDPQITSLAQQIGGLSASDPKAQDLWRQAEQIVVGQALGGFILFRSSLSAFNSSRLGDMSSLVLGQYVVPDPTKTFVKAG